MGKRTVINSSTRAEQSEVTVETANSEPVARITLGQYLNSILAGYPGQGTMIEPAYMKAPPGVIGSRANGMFLN